VLRTIRNFELTTAKATVIAAIITGVFAVVAALVSSGISDPTPIPTDTLTITQITTDTDTPEPPTETPTHTATSTATFTETPSPTPTYTATDTPTFTHTPSPTPTATATPTPSSPNLTARRDLIMRSGPGVEFPQVGILPAGEVLDVTGVSEDDEWYQVRSVDGTRSWVLKSPTFVDTAGDVQSLSVIVVPTFTLTLTRTPPPPEPPPTISAAQDTPAPPPTATPTVPSYPCDATIVFHRTGLLNIVRGGPSSRASYRPPIAQGAEITILSKAQETRDVFWYHIEYHIEDTNEKQQGWIPAEYAVLSSNCPE
jgi:hypothetical protein